MGQNKKIQNATVCSEGNLSFKSKLEKMIYLTLISLGLNPEYEGKTFIIWKGYSSATPFYDRESIAQRNKRLKKGILPTVRSLTLKSPKLLDITYTPDFYLRYNNLDVYIEAKGYEDARFPLKKKLFRKYLDDILNSIGQQSIYFEIYTKQQLLQAIDIIKNFKS